MDNRKDSVIISMMGSNDLFYSNLAKQLLLNIAYTLVAFSQAIRGPTLMDLQEIYQTSLEIVSLNFTASAIGGIIGSFGIGYAWSYYNHRKNLIMFAILVATAISTAFLPLAQDIWPFFAVSAIHGFFCTAMHTVASVLCLEIWSNGNFNSSPYMHSLHFCCSVGILLSPIAAKPFLSSRVYNNNNNDNNNSNTTEQEYINNNITTTEEDDTTNIQYLYPLTAVIILVVSLGYAYLAFLERNKHRKVTDTIDSTTTTTKETSSTTTTRNILVSLFVLFVVFLCPLDFSLGTYIPAFAVKSAYNLPKSEGANLLTIFLATYCASRISGVFLAMRFSPRLLFVFPNCVFVAVGTVLLLVAGESYYLVTQIGFGVVGFGMGSVVANMWMWLEGYTKVTGKISSYVNIGACLGSNLAPLLVGQLIEDEPMVLAYLLVVVLLIAVVVLSIGDWVGRRLVREEKLESMAEEHLLEKMKILDSSGDVKLVREGSEMLMRSL